MRTKRTIFERVLALALALVLTAGLMPAVTLNAAAIDAGSMVADNSTMNTWKNYFDRDDTAYAGAIWTDKSVFTDASAFSDVNVLPDGSAASVTVGQDNFLVALSAIASTSQITGHSTNPTDTMLVLDVSGSMVDDYTVGYRRQQNQGGGGPGGGNNGYQYRGVTAVDTANVEAMVEAANAAIDTLLKQNNHNRVGVVLYSGGSGGDATVLLPLGRYSGIAVTADGQTTYEYISADLETETQELYSRSGNNWNPTYTSMGQVTYNTDVAISLKNGLTTEAGAAVTDPAREVVGATFIQGGLYTAWQQFESRIQANDTAVGEGQAQAGTKRVPIMVLMSDGAPTKGTTDYYEADRETFGNGSDSTTALSFVSQLTASWVKAKMAAGYGTEAKFYTLGLGDAGTNSYAIGVMNPASASNVATSNWNTVLSGGSVEIDGENVSLPNDLDMVKNYADQYWYAADADAMINAFQQIVGEIVLQSKYYATLVSGGEHDIDGYITITDEIGEFMEVKSVTGIVIGNELYSGAEMAHALDTGVLGTPGNSTALGDEFIWTVQERLGIEQVSDAQALVSAAYAAKQLWPGDATAPMSNYIGWYESASGEYLGHWNDSHTEADYPANAAYISKSYGYLGDEQDSNLMHVVVKVSTNIANGNQTVSYQIPASLIPLVTYTITMEGQSLATATSITLENDADSQHPMRLLYEVGLVDGINEVNVASIMEDADHVHENMEDGSYSFYSNRWEERDYNDPTSHQVATAHFHPSLENEYYRFKEAETVLDEEGNPVTSLDTSGNTQYYYNRQVVSVSSGTAKVTDVRMPLAPKDLLYAELSGGNYVIPAGTPNLPANDVRIKKGENLTKTLDYYTYPYGVYGESANEYDMYAFLGNNGTFTITPATGLKLTKTVTEAVEGAATSFTFTVTLSEAAPGASVTDADGNALTGWSLSADNKVITVSLTAGQTVCIIGLPAGATYEVEEGASDDYTATISNATGTVTAQTLIKVDATNAPKSYGELLISKEVVHPNYTTDPEVLAAKEFTFNLVLSGSDISQGDVFATSLGKDVQVGENGVTKFADGTDIILKNEESLVIYGLPAGTEYTVTETGIPSGFALQSINANTSLTAASGEIGDSTASAAFVNRYPAEDFEEVSLNAQLNIQKILIDPDNKYDGDEDFVFVIQGLLADSTYPDIGDKITAKKNSTADAVRTLTFTDVGTYYFRIVEEAGATEGMTYSTERALFSIQVTDENMDGKLEIKAVTEEANVDAALSADGTTLTVTAAFTNTYSEESTSTVINVHKDLTNETGVAKSTTEFSFELLPANEDGVVTGAAVDTVTTSALGDATINLLIENDGVFYYVLREIIPETGSTVDGKPELNGMIYDPTEYLLKIEAENVEGVLSVTSQQIAVIGSEGVGEYADFGATDKANFENTYQLDEASILVHALKELTGRKPLSTDSFSFAIVRTDATFTNEHADTSNNKVFSVSGSDFGSNSSVLANRELTFAQAGTYYFTVTEVVPEGAVKNADGSYTKDGITYSVAQYHVTINVYDNGDGTLAASKVIHKVGQTDPLAPDQYPTFTNTYTVTGEAKLPLSGTKVLTGRAMQAGEFSFELYSNDQQKVLQTVSNHANGTFAFEDLVFTAADLGKTFTYTVSEVDGGKGGIGYDGTEWTVTVTVADNGKGGIVLLDAEDTPVTSITGLSFYNTYSTGPVSVTLSGTKTISGDRTALLEGETYEFELVDAQTGDVLQTVENEGGTFQFEALKYTYTDEKVNDLGKYYYVIREKVPADEDRQGGISYDASTYEVEVSVTDLNGVMSAKVTVTKPGVGEVSKDNITFGNTYTISGEKTLTLSGTKTYEDNALVGEDFTFQLLASDQTTVLQSVTNDANGDYSFEKLTFTTEHLGKSYTFYVREVKDGKGGVTYSTELYKIVASVSDNGDGTLKLETAITNKAEEPVDADALDFTNSYAASEDTVTLGGTKQITGDRTELLPIDIYTFELVDVEKNEVIDTATNDETGAFTFDVLRYTYTDENVNDIGEHNYIIREAATSLGGVERDKTEYTVKVTVTDKGGVLEAAVVVKNGEATVKKENIVFTNTYTINDEEELTLSGKKTLKYRDLDEKEFAFELVAADGTVLQTKENAADGSFTFDKLTYDADDAGKTYTYTVREFQPEEADKLPGVNYTDKSYTVVVKITDNNDGTLSMTYSVGGDDTTAGREAALNFENTYAATEATVTFGGTKKMDGDRTELLEKDRYTFELVDVEKNEVIDTATNDATGKFTFDTITYTYTDQNVNDLGEHKYIIREAETSLGGVERDDTEYAITVTVTDEGGWLKAVVAITDGENAVDEEDIVYTNIYSVTGTSKALEGTKELSGRAMTADDIYTFSVYENGQKVASGKNDGTKIVFDAISYSGAGVHNYVIKEDVPAGAELIDGVYVKDNVHYDATEFTAKVTVTDNTDGTLGYKVEYSKPVKFVNTYVPDDINVTLNVKKSVENKTSAGAIGPEGFQFTLAEDGKVIQTKLSDTDGNAAFALSYGADDVGEHTYIIRETDTKKTGVTYDDSYYTVVVTVKKDDITGDLSATYQVGVEDGATTDVTDVLVSFVNSYEKPTTPQTGDEFNIILVSALMLMSAAALAVLLLLKKKAIKEN